MITATIVDDEPDCCELLVMLLERYCPEVKVLDICYAAETAIQSIKEHQPQILFLDIEMPFMNGFQLLEKLGAINFELIFTTSYNQYAIKTIRFSALDYLLKPIDGKDLKAAVAKAEQRHWPQTQQLGLLKQQLHGGVKNLPDKIALPYQNGVTFAEIKNVIYCESDNNYTRIHTIDGNQYMVAKTLGDIQEVLEERNFLRIHRQYLINLDHIKKYVRGEGNYVIMSNNQSIPVARNQKEKLIEKFGWL